MPPARCTHLQHQGLINAPRETHQGPSAWHKLWVKFLCSTQARCYFSVHHLVVMFISGVIYMWMTSLEAQHQRPHRRCSARVASRAVSGVSCAAPFAFFTGAKWPARSTSMRHTFCALYSESKMKDSSLMPCTQQEDSGLQQGCVGG